MRVLAAGVLGVLLLASTVYAAKEHVSASALRAPGVYGRDDGVFLDSTTKSPVIVENGNPAMWVGAGYRETFAYGDNKGIAQLDSGGGGACAGNTTTVPCLAKFGDGVTLAWFPVVTATIELDMDATSLDVAGDQVDNDGTEIVGGVLGASGRPFVVGRDPAFYFCATIGVEDVSGSDDLHMGFRRAEAFNAVFDNYLDLASIGQISTDTYVETILANAATVSTDVGDWADLEVKKLCTYVSDAGVVTYKVNGAAVSAPAYTFADGVPVIPFLHFLHATDLAGEIDLTLWEVGYQN